MQKKRHQVQAVGGPGTFGELPSAPCHWEEAGSALGPGQWGFMEG